MKVGIEIPQLKVGQNSEKGRNVAGTHGNVQCKVGEIFSYQCFKHDAKNCNASRDKNNTTYDGIEFSYGGIDVFIFKCFTHETKTAM